MILLDADYLSYMVGSLAQSKERKDDYQTPVTVVDGDDEQVVWVKPEETVLSMLKWEVRKLQEKLGQSRLEVHLTPTGNATFRHRLAVTKPYKGQRVAAKPYWYPAIRDMMVEEWGAEVADDCEADDIVCQRQLQYQREGQQSIIVSNDKDLVNMYGWNYNPRTEVLRWVSDTQAAINFYTQMLTGDSADHIPGVYRLGKVKAAKILESCNNSLYSFMDAVHAQYDLRHDYDYMIEQGRLLHMQRTFGEMWDESYDWHAGYNPDLIAREDRPCLTLPTF